MALPSGTFSSPYAGLLEIVFSGEFSSQTGGDFGANTARYLALSCNVSNGSMIGKTYIKTGVPSSTLLLAYPGGNVAWSLSMAYEAHQLSGPSSVSVQNAAITCALIKR